MTYSTLLCLFCVLFFSVRHIVEYNAFVLQMFSRSTGKLFPLRAFICKASLSLRWVSFHDVSLVHLLFAISHFIRIMQSVTHFVALMTTLLLQHWSLTRIHPPAQPKHYTRRSCNRKGNEMIMQFSIARQLTRWWKLLPSTFRVLQCASWRNVLS